jgi:hypothetical protein
LSGWYDECAGQGADSIGPYRVGGSLQGTKTYPSLDRVDKVPVLFLRQACVCDCFGFFTFECLSGCYQRLGRIAAKIVRSAQLS